MRRKRKMRRIRRIMWLRERLTERLTRGNTELLGRRLELHGLSG